MNAVSSFCSYVFVPHFLFPKESRAKFYSILFGIEDRDFIHWDDVNYHYPIDVNIRPE